MENIEYRNSSIEDKKFEKKLINPEISIFLTELRKESLPFDQKAEKFEKFLLKRGDCTNITCIHCDVCVDEYFENGRTFSDIIEESLEGKDYETLSESEREKILKNVDNLIPKESETRVQAETPEGYLTFCFDCEATMCLNQVDYPDDIDWDKEHIKFTEEFLKKHAEFNVESFRLFGSTRRYICLDILSSNPDLEGSVKEVAIDNDRKVKINFTSKEFINLIKTHDPEHAKELLSLYRNLSKETSEGF